MITFLLTAVAVGVPLLQVRRAWTSLRWCVLSFAAGSVAWWGSGLLGWPPSGWEPWLLLMPLFVAAGLAARHCRRVWRRARQQFREAGEDD